MNGYLNKPIRLLLFLLTILISQPGWTKVADSIICKVFLKIISYDTKMMTGPIDEIKIGIISLKKNIQSQQDAKNKLESFEALKNWQIKGKSFTAKIISIKNAQDLITVIRRQSHDVLYLSDGLDNLIADIGSMANRNDILLITCNKNYLKKEVSVCVDGSGKNPKILLNLESATRQGASFDARLVRLSTIVNKD
jgi:hypothetical protein